VLILHADNTVIHYEVSALDDPNLKRYQSGDGFVGRMQICISLTAFSRMMRLNRMSTSSDSLCACVVDITSNICRYI